ncbi:MAG: bacteriohemerythrin [Azoarcus sp.]|jgi:hemerythrin|nr:bacteriohemerythrin [Azoarcus sp.]
MPWSEAFVLGIDSIDKQHRWLVDTTNRLYDQIESHHPDQEVIREILEGLAEYTMNHFILEEDLFNRLDYPEAAAHKERHDQFTRHAIELLLKFEEGEPVSDEALSFLQEWLIHHIMKDDRAYVPFLKRHGIT